MDIGIELMEKGPGCHWWSRRGGKDLTASILSFRCHGVTLKVATM